MDSTDIHESSGDSQSQQSYNNDAHHVEVKTDDRDDNEALHGLESETDPVAPQPMDEPSPANNVEAAPEVTDPASAAATPLLEAHAHPDAPAKASKVQSLMPGAVSFSGFNMHYLVEAVLVVIIIILALWGASVSSDRTKLTSDNQQLQNEVANPQALEQQQTQNLINKVGKLTKLPSGETPTVADVSNAAAARQQSAFFDSAQNGDKVLMYVKAGEAVLYRPSTNKVVLVAPLSITNTPTPSSATTTTKR